MLGLSGVSFKILSSAIKLFIVLSIRYKKEVFEMLISVQNKVNSHYVNHSASAGRAQAANLNSTPPNDTYASSKNNKQIAFKSSGGAVANGVAAVGFFAVLSYFGVPLWASLPTAAYLGLRRPLFK